MRSEVLKEVNKNISPVGHEQTKSGRKAPTFQKNLWQFPLKHSYLLPTSTEYKTVLHPEDGDTKLLWNIGTLLSQYTLPNPQFPFFVITAA
jgi:hypothetical protein